MKNTGFIVKLSLILFAIVFVCSFLLIVCNDLTKDRIADHAVKAEEEAKLEVLPDADSFDEISDISFDGITNAYIGLAIDKSVIGYCFKAESSGFGGKISMIVGVDTSGTVTGVKVTNMSETPGLGAKANEKAWTDNFKGKDGEISIIKKPNPGKNEVTAISGATITSKAVAQGVNDSLNAAAALMEKEGK